jgi:DNA-binding MarR family transcriptional regulator
MLTAVTREEAALLRQQFMALQRRLRREMKSGPVPMSDLLVLGAIARRGAPVTPGILAEELFMATSNVAAALRALEQADLILRRKDPADARRALIELTCGGQRLVSDDRRQRDEWLRATASAALSSEEQDTLRKAGELMSRLAYHGMDSAPPDLSAPEAEAAETS